MPVNLNNNPVSSISHSKALPTRLRAHATSVVIKRAPTIKEGLLDLVLDAKKLRLLLACLQLTTLDARDILLTILKEVLTSSVDAFAAFASMDMAFARHNGTRVAVTFPPHRYLSVAALRTLRPFRPHPAVPGRWLLPSRRLGMGEAQLLVQNSDACTSRGTSARGQSSGQLRMRERDERRAGVPSNSAHGARRPHLAASTGSSRSQPSAYASPAPLKARRPPLAGPVLSAQRLGVQTAARTYSTSVESDVFRFRSGLNAITWLTSAVDTEMHGVPLTTVSTVLSIS
ncbi:hypothetical protein C8J57DRAFT_1722798 [Mycena rebaudengoi]|nr:hypothetical protein C8J57DRAFT_1722798 [Mycena rebaudengoi]